MKIKETPCNQSQKKDGGVLGSSILKTVRILIGVVSSSPTAPVRLLKKRTKTKTDKKQKKGPFREGRSGQLLAAKDKKELNFTFWRLWWTLKK